ncbi:MAG: hypothetical protein ACOH2L_12610 [Devosia sp.]
MMRTLVTAFALLALTGAVAAQERLPDGAIATAGGSGAVQAWYAQPTTRYDHGILGDAIEAGALVVVDAQGQQYRLILPERQVFEDITPRLIDLDGDGRNEIVTIRTDLAAGAAVAVYQLAGGKVQERAATAPLGQPHRWLSIAAIANFTDDAGLEIAIVKTPHIGGVLEILSLQGHSLKSIRPPQPGFSTHFIGSRDLSLAHAQDVDGDNFAELALPTQDRRRVMVLGFAPTVHGVGSFAPGGAITRPLGDFAAALAASRSKQ